MIGLDATSMLGGAEGLLSLLFTLAALYFSWILARTQPGAETRWFFRGVAAALALKGIAFAVGAVPTLGVLFAMAPMAWQITTILAVGLAVLEELAWLLAALAFLRHSILRKRRMA